MKISGYGWWLSIILGVLLVGCASVPVTYYSLRPIAPANNEMNTSGPNIVVSTVDPPAAVNRLQLVMQSGGGEVNVLEQQRWVGSLSSLLTQVVAVNLSRQLGKSNVYAYPQPGMRQGDMVVNVDVRSFDLVLGKKAVLEASWQLIKPGVGVINTGYFHQEQVISAGQGTSALVMAEETLLAQLCVEIGRGIRSVV